MIPATALYAGLLTAVYAALSVHIGRARRRAGVSILHGDDMHLAQAIRRHGNFIETVPLALILMGVVEACGGSAALLHGAGAVLVLSRIAHPIGLRHDRMVHPLRMIGMGGTLLVILALGVAALVQGWQAL